MWEQYEEEEQPYRKVKILEAIASAQSNITAYYESSTIALEVSAKFNSNGNADGDADEPLV
jgi:hypothetical protein